jgi:transposase
MRHHDFAGLTTKQVAAKLGVTPKCINSYMRKMRKIAPQLFPILTPRQMDVYVLYEQMGMSHPEVEKYLGMSAGTSGATIWYMRKKGMY